MTNSSSVVEACELRRRYEGYEAVRGVSFRVERGELFALLGTNGAGKTSTLELVEGLGRPNGGSVRVLGHDPYTQRARLRPRIGVMLQEGGFPPDLTVAETAAMWGGTLTRPRPVAEALALAGMDHRAGVRVKQLSGGERRRLDLALAILGRPEVLFLDEPTTGLDPESRRDAWRLVRDLLREGVTVLLTTHYLEEAQELADRLAIMHRGQVMAAGSLSEVIAAYPARIRFTLPDNVFPGDLPALPESRPPEREGPRLTVHTSAPQRALTVLLCWAAERGIALGELDARPASLEEAFLAIAAAGGPR
jgi:ABC-2 type transport system ATP-binding protein